MKLEEAFDMRDFTEAELERLEHEIAVIKRARCEQAIVKAIEKIKAIPRGKEFYIVGAANCSFLLYAMGITKVDPIRFDLPFERFLNPLEDTTLVIQPEFAPKAHMQTDLTLEELITMQGMDKKIEPTAIPISKYKNQPLYDMLRETRGNVVWQEQFINILNRVGGMLPEFADRARRNICKYGIDDWNCSIFYDWFSAHSERLGYDCFEIGDYAFETEKIRKGYAAVRRRIPISPMFRKVWDMIDFEKAKVASSKTLSDTIKKVFPERHVHELRYTFISRCKECGCNLELVMLWDGHEFDKDVRTSKVDRGYTQYSDEIYFGDIEKVNYEL